MRRTTSILLALFAAAIGARAADGAAGSTRSDPIPLLYNGTKA